MIHLKRFFIGLLAIPFYLLFWLLIAFILVLCIPLGVILMPLFGIYDLGKDLVG